MSRFEFRYALFTYSQCGDLEPEAVGLMLSDLGAECIIGREDHADGGIHLHAFAEFQPRLRKRGHVWADVKGFHPNIQPVTKTPWMTYDYAIKDGDVVWGGLERPPMTKKATHEAKEGSKAEAWLDLVNAESSEIFWRRKRCLVLYGPSRTGKTQWVRSLGKHIYFGGLYSPGDAAKYMKSVEYAVFDDISGGMKFFHHLKAWFGCQMDISIKRLYREPKLHRWGKPSVWVSNDDPRVGMDPGDCDWFEANAVFVEIKDKLFEKQEPRAELCLEGGVLGKTAREVEPLCEEEQARLDRGGSPDMSEVDIEEGHLEYIHPAAQYHMDDDCYVLDRFTGAWNR
ncbi:MAG: replication-associated protein [Genomoviridae sp.]|nr:MAG: replication-associated protein [Genomoviridae sp.]